MDGGYDYFLFTGCCFDKFGCSYIPVHSSFLPHQHLTPMFRCPLFTKNGKSFFLNNVDRFCMSGLRHVSQQPQQPEQTIFHISYPILDALFLFIDGGQHGINANNASDPSSMEKKSKGGMNNLILAPTQSLDYSSTLLLDVLHPENEIEAIPDLKHDDIMTRYVFEIEKQYHLDESKKQKVGGMGESDGGVWFVPYPLVTNNNEPPPLDVIEPLSQWELIRDTIAVVKHRRHGIPFGVYTSGLVDASLASKLKDCIGLKRCIVSLGVSNPMSYEKKMFIRNNNTSDSQQLDSPSKQFQSICSFIALAAESGFPIEVAVLEGDEAAATSDLAKALGAVHVHNFPHPQIKNYSLSKRN